MSVYQLRILLINIIIILFIRGYITYCILYLFSLWVELHEVVLNLLLIHE